MSEAPSLPRRPEARSQKVEDLVDLVLRGVIRVRDFQRPLQWDAHDVRMFFDSIYKGYPVGSLLFYKRPADAKRLQVGPLTVEAPDLPDGWWVVDGQQRITSLAACLGRAVPLPSQPSQDDPYVLFFDPKSHAFLSPPTSGAVPQTWVPLPILLDASRLTEWVFGWEHGRDEALRRTVFDAGTRLREYQIPLYLIEAEEERAHDIFFRVNKAGKPLQWTDIHKALFGRSKSSPSTLADLAEELSSVGMGSLPESRLLTTLMALRGEDPTRTLEEHIARNRSVLSGAVKEALPVLRRVLSFLRRDAGILHLRLLPKSILLDVLTRFFALHPDPGERTRRLLARWFWRTVLGAGAYEDRTLRRSGIKAVVEDEEATAQNLLRLVHQETPRKLELATRFDGRSDASRIALLTLAHLHPRNLITGESLDVTRLIEDEDKRAFLRVIKTTGLQLSQSPANRVLQPKGTPVRTALVERIRGWGPQDPVVASHAISPAAARQLIGGSDETFLDERSKTLSQEIDLFAARRAEWGHNDRPSLSYLLQAAAEGA